MNKIKTIFMASILEVLLVLCVGGANLLLKPIYYFCFYNVLYGILFSFLIPLFLLQKEENVFDFLGIKALGKKQVFILVVFIAFSVGGQIIPIVTKGGIIPWNLLPMGLVPLIMTTFFEEFLFRGFFQNKFEKEFGTITAILISGLMFSLYHVGYPRFRTFEDILLLFAVGIGFAAAYKLSGNNLIVAYFVNLPNAFVTYMLKFEQFPKMTMYSTMASIITLCIILVVFIMLVRANRKER
mgnify:CR=1 FL=1